MQNCLDGLGSQECRFENYILPNLLKSGNEWNTQIDKLEKNRNQRAGNAQTLSVENANFFDSFQIRELTKFKKKLSFLKLVQLKF